MNSKNFLFELPGWVGVFLKQGKLYPDINDRMNLVIEASANNVRGKSGGPFAAAVFEISSGRIISLGVNLVTTQGSSIFHAEIVAILIAQKRLGTYDLGGEEMQRYELVASTEPCAMCFGAIPWSGVRRVITGAKGEDARAIGFDEGPKVSDWSKELNNRGIEIIKNVQRMEAKAVLDEYAKQGGHIYNSREAR